MDSNERDTRPASRDNAAANNPDLYTWSGDCARDASGGKNGANKGANTGGDDKYQFDGSGKRQASGGSDEQPAPGDHVPKNWHPDLSLSSASAKEWFKESQQLRKQKLDLDENGDHTVQHGDSLWTIAQRELHDHGKQGSHQEIREEIGRIAKLNEKLHPSLDPQKDFIGDGWKLHIEPRQPKDAPQPPAPVDKTQPAPPVDKTPPPNADDRCVPSHKSHDEVTPPGYRSKPSVIVNNVYTENAYFDQRGNGATGPAQFDQNRAIPDRGGDVYRYSGDRGPASNNGDLYQYGGDQRGRNQVQPNNGDVYQYSGDQRYNPGQNSGDVYQYSGDQRYSQNQVSDVDRYGDGTSFYPGRGSAADQLNGRQIINNVYAQNAYFDQRGGNFDQNPNCRIMHREPVQSGEDNYYNCRERGGRHHRGGGYIQMNDGGSGNYSYQEQQPPQYQNGTGRTQYFTYNPQGNRGGDYYSRARSQQGFNVNDTPANYRNPNANEGDDQYAY